MRKSAMVVILICLVGSLAVADQIGSGGRIAVIPDPSHYHRGEWPLSADLVTEALCGRGYQVVERANLGSVLREQDLALTGRMDMTSVARIGRLLGATYLLFVSDQISDGEREIRTSSFRAREYRVMVEVHGRCLEVETGQTIWAGTGYGDDKAHSGGSQRRSRRHSQGDILQVVGQLLAGASYQERPDTDAMVVTALKEAAHSLISKISTSSASQRTASSGEEYINLRVDSSTQVGDRFILLDRTNREVGRVVVAQILASGQIRAQLISGTLTGATRAVPAIRTIPVTR